MRSSHYLFYLFYSIAPLLSFANAAGFFKLQANECGGAIADPATRNIYI